MTEETIQAILEGCEVGRVEEKVWGKEIYLINTPAYCAKRLLINPLWQCSNHRHLTKDETFYVEMGTGWIMLSGRPYKLTPGALVRIPAKVWHTVWNEGPKMLVLLEVSSRHRDEDVERQIESAAMELLPIITITGLFQE